MYWDYGVRQVNGEFLVAVIPYFGTVIQEYDRLLHFKSWYLARVFSPSPREEIGTCQLSVQIQSVSASCPDTQCVSSPSRYIVCQLSVQIRSVSALRPDT